MYIPRIILNKYTLPDLPKEIWYRYILPRARHPALLRLVFLQWRDLTIVDCRLGSVISRAAKNGYVNIMCWLLDMGVQVFRVLR